MNVILFDGVCNLCNGLVNWIIDRDKQNLFMFASLQSGYGKNAAFQSGINTEYMNTVILIEDGKLYQRSTAVLRILKRLGYPYKLAYAGIIFPLFIRNGVYNFVARNRYKWFGKRDVCRVPEPGLKAKFIE
jgi:predicted DCC family thiol-disulfide oxidoreductase YuxK